MAADLLASYEWRSIGANIALIVGATLFVFILVRLTQNKRHTEFPLGDEFGASRATVESWAGDRGYVRIAGELWKASSKSAFAPGDRVRVARIEGMLLKVVR